MAASTPTVEAWHLRAGEIVLAPQSEAPKAPHLVLLTTNGEQHQLELSAQNGGLTFNPEEVAHPIQSARLTDGNRDEAIGELNGLFPETDEAFEEQFRSKRDRPQEPYLDYFIAWQVFHHFQGKPAYRVNCAVVCAYKALELMRPELLDESEHLLHEALSVLPSVELGPGPRTNREHLHVSVLYALAQINLAQGHADSFLDTLFTLRTLLTESDFKSYFNLAYNSIRGLRMLTVLYRMAGMDSEARATAELSRKIFVRGVQDSTNNVTHFKELGSTHQAAFETLRSAKKVKLITPGLLAKTVRATVRVDADEHPENHNVYRANFVTAAKKLGDGSTPGFRDE